MIAENLAEEVFLNVFFGDNYIKFMEYSKEEKKYLLDLGRRAIENFLKKGTELRLSENEVSQKIKEIKACFVTLTINGHLRGCIGDIVAYQPLYKDVIKNAIAAAFYDPRFEALSYIEFGRVEIEISVLGNFRKGVLKDIKKGDGVILEKDGYRAVFLPQVWKELPGREDFLRHLSLKAGLSEEGWRGAQYVVFGAEVIK